VNKQPVPEIWKDLSLEERAAAIRTYSQETVSRLLETGIDVPYYAIGNETDFGIAGVFAELDQRSIENLENNIWPKTAALLQAGIEGVRQVDPDALILLHIAQSYAPSFVRAYFRSMQDLGVEFDIAGLSLYPSAFGPTVIEGFCQSIELLGSELGLPVIIPEFAYPADPPTGSLFASWYNDLPGYPLTPEGQAQWLADFFEAMRAHPNVIGAYYFSPTYYWSGDLWGSFSLFDQEGRAYPAIGAFTPPE
jgi:arabinogalactan endo-1,4-beta-galactosidase